MAGSDEGEDPQQNTKAHNSVIPAVNFKESLDEPRCWLTATDAVTEAAGGWLGTADLPDVALFMRAPAAPVPTLAETCSCGLSSQIPSTTFMLFIC